ncbi:MAG: chemotaxis protein CheC [bacterium]
MIEDLTSIELDALKEVGNIGAGNAATALSQIIDKKIIMTVPKVSIVRLEQVQDVVGGPETLVVGIYTRVLGDAPSNIMFLLPRESGLALVDMVMGRPQGSTRTLTEIEQSALKEIGNILGSAYLNALSKFANLNLIPSVPALAFDMAGAILSVVSIELSQLGDYALFIETDFADKSDLVKGHFFLIPDPGSLDIVLEAIGIVTGFRRRERSS